ncbi:MAG: type I 3-dehydroquinate dehydratase [Acidobacteriota bacterium]
MEIIASFVPESGRDPRVELSHPPAGATMVEIRADLLGVESDFAAVLAACPRPVVLTLRSAAEGGQGPDDPGARHAFFARTAELPVAFFDLEARRDCDLLAAILPRERVILSWHDPSGTPRDLEEQAAALLARGTRLVKLVPEARTLADVTAVLRLAQALSRGRTEHRRAIVFATGEVGRGTRLASPLLAAPVAYAAWSERRLAAAGQYTAAELLALIGHLQGRPQRTFAVLGKPVCGSLSPRMHAAAYRAAGLPNLFIPLEVSEEDELAEVIAPAGETCLDRAGLPAGGFAVTMPWKEAAARRCGVLAPRAQRAGVANTILPRAGKILGDCTDIDGISRVLGELGVELGGVRALVLGAGGAARAAVVALQLGGAEVALAGRDVARTAELARRLGAVAAEPRDSEQVRVVVNATPAGRDGAPDGWLETLRAPAGAAIVDLPYGEAPTFLEQLAAARGWDYAGGREVLLYQGVAQFAAMTGVAPPVRAMAAAVGLEEVE